MSLCYCMARTNYERYASHADLLASIYVSEHHHATAGVTCVDQSYATVTEVPCFPHCPLFFLRLERVATDPWLRCIRVGTFGSRIASSVVAEKVAHLTSHVVHHTYFNPNTLSVFISIVLIMLFHFQSIKLQWYQRNGCLLLYPNHNRLSIYVSITSVMLDHCQSIKEVAMV